MSSRGGDNSEVVKLTIKNTTVCQDTSKLLLADTISRDESQNVDMASSSICNTGQSSNPKRRGYMFNEANGQMERVIRKRKRKSVNQLEELALAFDTDPHWSKETLFQIATKTSLTEAQVYKWGWDQKRKKYGVAEAERMR